MFGSKPTFGASGSSLFGQAKPTTSVFGQQSTPGTSSLFGSQQKTTTNLFGNTAAQPQTSSLFGSPQQTNTGGSSLFGQQPKSLFGSTPQQTTSAFGTTGTTSLFGNSNANTSGSLFGAQPVVNGTTVKFDPLIGTDSMVRNGQTQNINTKHLCITAMKHYEGKSLEELRVDDYIANRKTGTATTSGGLFGSSTTTGTSSLFGNTAKPAFGATATTSPFGGSAMSTGTTSLFGSTQPAQQQTTSLFGNSPKPATGGLFGSNTATTGTTFGSTTGTTSLFGTQNTGYGASQPQQTTSLFGSQPAASTASTGFTFGSQPATTTNAFGQPAASTGGLFGSPANTQQQTTSLFGTKPAATNTFNFGNAATGQAANTSGGLFGSKPGGLFGSQPAAGAAPSLFGSQPAQTGGLFGSQPAGQPATGTLFGGPATQQTVAAPTTVTMAAAAPIVLGSGQAQLEMALIEAQLANSPYGDSSLLKLTGGKKDTDDMPNPTSIQRQLRFLASKKNALSSPTSANGASAPSSASSNNESRSELFLADMPILKTSVLDTSLSKTRSSVLPLGVGDFRYKSSVVAPTLGRGIRSTTPLNTSAISNRSHNTSLTGRRTVDSVIEAMNGGSAQRRGNIKHIDLQVLDSHMKAQSKNSRPHHPDELPRRDADETVASEQPERGDIGYSSPEFNPHSAVQQRGDALRAGYQAPRLNLEDSLMSDVATSPRVSGSATNMSTTSPRGGRSAGGDVATDGSGSTSAQRARSPPRHRAPAGVRLSPTAVDYFTEPSIEAMNEMIIDGSVVIPNGFTIGRAGYGTVFWPGRAVLKNMVLDELVIFRHKEVTVYPDENLKPSEGEGLNKPAEVTLERVWMLDKTTKREIKDPLELADAGWRERLERVTAKMGASFKDYRPATGSWVFRVEHFSKYGIADDDDDEEMPAATGEAQDNESESGEMNDSMRDQAIQGKVQRAKMALASRTAGVAMEQMVVDTELPSESELQRLRARSKALRQVGLGGDLLRTLQVTSEVDYEEREAIPADDDDWLMGNDFPPEKKTKMEDGDELDAVLAKSEALRGRSAPVQETRTPPQCIAPSTLFTGGLKASKSKRSGLSKYIDAGCARGASSQIGWGAGGKYVVSLQPEFNEVAIEQALVESDVPEEYVVEQLEHWQRLSTSAPAQMVHVNGFVEGSVKRAPFRDSPAPDCASQLMELLCATAKKNKEMEDMRVFELCQVLFPDRKNRIGRWNWSRTDALSDWWTEEVKSEIAARKAAKTSTQADVETVGNVVHERGARVWTALCEGKCQEAISFSIEDGLLHLASVLSMFTVDPMANRQHFEQQIDLWSRDLALGLLELPLLKIYLMLAGRTHAGRTRINARGRSTETVNILEGLSWKQAFGLHVWWLRGDKPLEEVLKAFDKDVESGRAATANSHLYYELVRLACSSSHRVESVLDAASIFTGGLRDKRLSWHLWSVLSTVGYKSMQPENEQRLHCEFAEQLRLAGMSPLSVFVLSHIRHDEIRSEHIKELLYREAFTADEDDYRQMIEAFGTPEEWIAAAMLPKYKQLGNMEAACDLALRAGELETAHRIFVDEVAPNLVASSEIGALRDLCARFEKVADRIPAWGVYGQLYVDYCEMLHMASRDEADMTGPNEKRYMDLIDSVESRLVKENFKKPIQIFCMQTIAQELFEIQSSRGRINDKLPLSNEQIEKFIRHFRI